MKLQDFSAPDFYKKLINNLPGVFYLYELAGDKIFLKLWNENHVESFGYSDEELKLNLNKRKSM